MWWNNLPDKYNLPVGNEKIKLLTAIGTESICNKTKHLKTNILRRDNSISFIITDLVVVDVLIGLDWLNKHKVLTINTLIFKKTSTQKHEYEINFPNNFKY